MANTNPGNKPTGTIPKTAPSAERKKDASSVLTFFLVVALLGALAGAVYEHAAYKQEKGHEDTASSDNLNGQTPANTEPGGAAASGGASAMGSGAPVTPGSDASGGSGNAPAAANGNSASTGTPAAGGGTAAPTNTGVSNQSAEGNTQSLGNAQPAAGGSAPASQQGGNAASPGAGSGH